MFNSFTTAENLTNESNNNTNCNSHPSDDFFYYKLYNKYVLAEEEENHKKIKLKKSMDLNEVYLTENDYVSLNNCNIQSKNLIPFEDPFSNTDSDVFNIDITSSDRSETTKIRYFKKPYFNAKLVKHLFVSSYNCISEKRRLHFYLKSNEIPEPDIKNLSLDSLKLSNKEYNKIFVSKNYPEFQVYENTDSESEDEFVRIHINKTGALDNTKAFLRINKESMEVSQRPSIVIKENGVYYNSKKQRLWMKKFPVPYKKG